MDRRPLYAAFLILVIALTSAQYLSYSTQLGLGELQIDEILVESVTGVNMSARVFHLRYPNYDDDIPLIVTLHGPSNKASDLYGFNIELARRNLTVVSIVLEGFNSTKLTNESFLNRTGFQCSEVIEHVKDEFEVDDSHYGILAHAEGFQIALRMLNYTGIPNAIMTIGNVGDTTSNQVSLIPGNLLVSAGENDPSFSTQDAINFAEDVSGLSNLSLGTIYGNLAKTSAFKVITSTSNEITDLLDPYFIKESCRWMIGALEGNDQLEQTLSIDETIFQYQIQSDMIMYSSIIGIGAVIVLLIYSILPERFRLRI